MIITYIAIIGLKQRGGKIKAEPIKDTSLSTTHKVILDNVKIGSQLYTDDARHWTKGVHGYQHQSVNHSAKEYVNGMAHTNGIESFWALLKRGFYGTHHHMSNKHIGRYVSEFAGRKNDRKTDTICQMQTIAGSMIGAQLRYKDLVA